MARRLSSKNGLRSLVGALLTAAAVMSPILVAAQSQAPVAEVRVQGSRPDNGSTLEPVERYDAAYIAQTDAFTADEVLAELTADLPATDQIVLIDGRETQVDISTIPMEMIDRIEVSTSGEMPDGRPRFLGNVINVILKKNYNGATFSARQRAAFAGGGRQNQLNASGGRNLGRLSGRINLQRRDQEPLRASEREFSIDQNHAAEGGSDYRAPYGESPVVQAVSGPLSGITDATGAPTSIALAPEAPSGQPLDVSDFLGAPAGTRTAAGLRRFNTADFQYLVTPSTSYAANGELAYEVTENTRVRGGYSYQRSDSSQSSAPPITRAGPASVVPAAYNPFGQDIQVGLVHSGFGPVQRESEMRRHSGFFFAEGQLSETWSWNGRFDRNHRVTNSATTDLDALKFAAALAAADPSQRFDPFAEMGSGSANAELYPSLTTVRASAGTSDDTRVRLESRGELSKGWIDPITLRLGAERSTNESRQRIDRGASFGPPIDAGSELRSLRATASLDIPAFRVRELAAPAIFSLTGYVTQDEQQVTQSASRPSSQLDVDTTTLGALLNVPWFVPADENPGIRELQTQIGAGAAHVDGETYMTERAGIVWSPGKTWTFRTDFSRQVRPIPTTLYTLSVDYNQTLIDRLRSNISVDDVEVVSRQPDAQSPPLMSRFQLSAQWMPAALDALKLTLSYTDQEQKGQQRTFSAQDILDNEVALDGRVVRLPPTPAEIALGIPGQVAQVDITPFSGGRREDRRLALRTQYRDEIGDLGTFRWRARAEHLLSSTNELLSGIRVQSTNDREVPPEWRVWTQTDWKRGSWGATASYNYISGGEYAGLAYSSFSTLDARVAYSIGSPWGERFGSTFRIGLGVRNVLDRDPPFANTLNGFRGGSPLGRTYELTLRVPLGS